jgi:hypothetical protein
MRDPRPGLTWSRRRVVVRRTYAAWMASEAWQVRRRGWLESWIATYDQPPSCQACGGPWSLTDGDLHHRSYTRLGHEADTDLIPLDRGCHTRVHRILDSHPGWLRTGREQASDMIVARLRHTKGDQR